MRPHINAISVSKLSHKKVILKTIWGDILDKNLTYVIYVKRHSGKQNILQFICGHILDKNHIPNLSGISFSDNSYFRRHMRAHIWEKYVSAATVTNHLGLINKTLEIIHWWDPISMQPVWQIFHRKSYLKDHLKRHIGEKTY